MNEPYSINYPSDQKLFVSALRKLKDDTDVDSRSLAIETLFRSLIVDHGIDTDESKFDFVMDDGIDMMTRAIVDKDCSTLHIVQGFHILFAIAEDSKWHWQSVFDGIGGINGIMNLLEYHRMDSTILSNILFMMSKLSKFGFHRFQGSQIVRWLSFFDLVLEGVEENVNSLEVFRSFCLYMRIQSDNSCPPQEVHERILICVCRGLDAHPENLECQQVGQSILLRFQPDETTGVLRMVPANHNRTDTLQVSDISNSRTTRSRYSANPFGHSRCAPAA
jgi:hypothetical protein